MRLQSSGILHCCMWHRQLSSICTFCACRVALPCTTTIPGGPTTDLLPTQWPQHTKRMRSNSRMVGFAADNHVQCSLHTTDSGQCDTTTSTKKDCVRIVVAHCATMCMCALRTLVLHKSLQLLWGQLPLLAPRSFKFSYSASCTQSRRYY